MFERSALRQFSQFAAIGGAGFVVDTIVFTALRTTVLAPEVISSGPLIAKVISTTVAILVNWIGNRLLTFRDSRRSNVATEGLQFAVVSVGGLLIALGCLVISHYVLGFHSALADTIAGNGVGLALGTAFRFALYRSWVFAPA